MIIKVPSKSGHSTILIPTIPETFPAVFSKQGDKDFPPAAAQVAHQKPHPSVEKLPHPQHVKQHIHQPRK
uniref:Death-associated protein 1 n=1 Tax=Cyanistes caeruleus TaxID=156563 RepID=A0A8C0UXB9_CYACU